MTKMKGGKIKVMKKNLVILSLMVMIVMTIGVASAAFGVNFISPTQSVNISNELLVDWNNIGSAPGLYLQYKEGNCSPGTWNDLGGPFGGSETEYLWDTTIVDDGEYCLRLRINSLDYDISGPFTIDNTPPTAVISKPLLTDELIVYEPVKFHGKKSEDNEGGTGIKSYSWDFDEDGIEDSTKKNPKHTYIESGTYDVVLTVTDYAGNEDSTTEKIKILDLPLEDETFSYESGILGIAPILNETFDTELTGVTCIILPSSEEITNIAVSSLGGNCTINEISDIPYNERGVHNLIIRAEGDEGVKYYVVEISVYTWWIKLYEGWNLISVPMIPEDTGIDKVILDQLYDSLPSSGSCVYQFDETEKAWLKSKRSGTGDLDDIVPGYGYWIKVTKDVELKGIGSITPEIGQLPLSATVTNGWNLIGHYGLKKLKVVKALSSLVIGNNQYWNSVVIPDGSGKLKKYKGYWMSAKFLPNGEALYTPSQEALDSVYP